MTYETMVSNIGTSIAWPSPVRSRWSRAARTALATKRPTVLSATMVGA